MTYRVGPGEDCQYPGMPELLNDNVLQPGDLVEITCGKVYKSANKYVFPVAGSTTPITFRGISDANGSRPVFDGRGKMFEAPRAFFEFYNANGSQNAADGAWVVENIEFAYAKNNDSDMNASAVRNVRAASVRVTNCKIWNCASGVMSSNTSGDTVVEDSDLGFLGYGDGHSHCIYVQGKRFRLRNSRVHDSTMGQCVKVRNRYVDVSYNQIFSSRDGELGIIQNGNGTDEESGGGLTGEPGADAIVVDNEIVTRTDRGGGNKGHVVTFGRDMGTRGRNGTLFFHGNRVFANDHVYNNHLTLFGDRTSLDARHNKFVGSPHILSERDPAVSIKGEWNWMGEDAEVPAQFVNPAIYGYTMGPDFASNASPGRRRPRTTIPAPVELRDWNDQGGLGIAWEPVPGAVFYRVWRYLLQNGAPANANTVWGGSTEACYVDTFQNYASKSDKQLQYVYRVTAVDMSGNSSPLSAKWIKEHGKPGFPA